jgi:hypothetical protein
MCYLLANHEPRTSTLSSQLTNYRFCEHQREAVICHRSLSAHSNHFVKLASSPQSHPPSPIHCLLQPQGGPVPCYSYTASTAPSPPWHNSREHLRPASLFKLRTAHLTFLSLSSSPSSPSRHPFLCGPDELKIEALTSDNLCEARRPL